LRKREIKNLAASVHQRLLNKAKASGRPFNEVLQYYAIERFIYRLSKTPHAKKFILKGALMFNVWQTLHSRPTKDIDLLGKLQNKINLINSAIKDACLQKVEPDGILFHAESISATTIKENTDYEGIRVRLRGNLGTIKLSLQLDIGFGDVVVPQVFKITYPTILDFPPPILYGYSMESTIAEKFHTMAQLNILNSRMKDFFDIWRLSRQFDFKGEILAEALYKTFKIRSTDIPSQPMKFMEILASEAIKETQWQAFLRKTKTNIPPISFAEVISSIKAFLEPVLTALSQGKDFRKTWKAPGPWR